MDDDLQERRGPITPEEFEVRGPGGIGMSFKGQSQQLLVILLIFTVAGGLGYMLWEHSQDEKTSKGDIIKAVQKISDSQEELSYITSLTPEDRAKLRLDMPDSLRKRLRDR